MEETIFKDPVIGFLIIKGKYRKTRPDEVTHYVQCKPITSDWEGIGDEINLMSDDEIMGIIPAPPESYTVYGEVNSENILLLGYEFKNCYHPDWEKILKEKREMYGTL